MAVLASLGGARPTGVGWVDAVLLALGGVALSACALRARTVPVYLAAGAAALCQPEPLPLALGCLAVVAAFSRRFASRSSVLGAVAGGLTWAATVGAPFESGARPAAVPLVAAGWVVLSAHRHGSRRFRTRVVRVAAVAGGLVVVGAGLSVLSVASARPHLDRGADLVDSGLAAARRGDVDAALEDLRAGRRALARGGNSLTAAWVKPAWIIPGVSQNVRALDTTIREVRRLADVSIATAQSTDLASLTASGGQVDLAAVQAMEAPLAEVVAALTRAQRELAGAQDQWLAGPLADRLDDLLADLQDAGESAELALDGVRVAPELLGGDGPRTYLVLFTTPVEARPTGGFPGNYAEVSFTDGRFEMPRFGRISELNAEPGAPPRTVSGPRDFLERYARFGADHDWRNLTMSPDLPSVAAVASELYPQSGGRQIDGMMTVDPTALAALMEFTGPIAIPGLDEMLTSANAADFLLRRQYVELPDNPKRVDALETLSEIAFGRLQTADLPGPQRLGDVLGPIVERKHLQVMAFGQAPTAFLDDLGITGRYPAVEGDFLGVTTSNAAGSKIDLFLRRSLDYDVQWDPSTGQISGTVTVTLTNEAPASGLPAYVIGNVLGRRPLEAELPDGWNNVFLTIYTPWDDDGASLDGEPLGLERIDELGRRAFSTFVPIAPGATRTVVLELNGQIDSRTYELGIGAQPLVEPEQLTIRIAPAGGGPVVTTGPVHLDGRTVVADLPLVRDEHLTVRGT